MYRVLAPVIIVLNDNHYGLKAGKYSPAGGTPKKRSRGSDEPRPTVLVGFNQLYEVYLQGCSVGDKSQRNDKIPT